MSQVPPNQNPAYSPTFNKKKEKKSLILMIDSNTFLYCLSIIYCHISKYIWFSRLQLQKSYIWKDLIECKCKKILYYQCVKIKSWNGATFTNTIFYKLHTLFLYLKKSSSAIYKRVKKSEVDKLINNWYIICMFGLRSSHRR